MNAGEIIKLYSETVGEEMGYKLKFLHLFNFHAIIGACLSDQRVPIAGQEIDLRIHPFIIQPSGSGKALSYDQAEKVSREVGLDWRTITKLTPAALVGTVYRVGKDVIIKPGYAADADVLGFAEAHVLIRGGKESEIMIDYVNQILDVKAYVHRPLAYGTIEYPTHVTLVLSSYPSRLLYEQVCAGFLQRCFVWYDDVELDDYLKICKWLFEHVGISKESDIEKKSESIVSRLKEIKERDFKFSFDSVRKQLMEEIPTEFKNVLIGYHVSEELSKTFVSRYTTLIQKLCCHHAALELRDNIKEEDVKYAKEIALASLRSVCCFMEKYIEVDKKEQAVDRVLRRWKNEGEKETKLTKLLQYANIKKNRALQILKLREIRGKIKLETRGKATWIIFQD